MMEKPETAMKAITRNLEREIWDGAFSEVSQPKRNAASDNNIEIFKKFFISFTYFRIEPPVCNPQFAFF